MRLACATTRPKGTSDGRSTRLTARLPAWYRSPGNSVCQVRHRPRRRRCSRTERLSARCHRIDLCQFTNRGSTPRHQTVNASPRPTRSTLLPPHQVLTMPNSQWKITVIASSEAQCPQNAATRFHVESVPGARFPAFNRFATARNLRRQPATSAPPATQ
jgi:hypothetical protein